MKVLPARLAVGEGEAGSQDCRSKWQLGTAGHLLVGQLGWCDGFQVGPASAPAFSFSSTGLLFQGGS